MGEYYEEKHLKEAKHVPENKIKTFKRTKNCKKATDVPTHSQDRKKVIERKMEKSNSKPIVSGTFDFDPEDYLEKSLLFDLKKISEEKFVNARIEKIPDNDKYYIEHREGTNPFYIRKDEKQGEKDELIQLIENLDKKINKIKNKLRISKLKRIRKEALQRYAFLRETFIDIDNEKTEILDVLLNIDRNLATREIEKSKVASATHNQNKIRKLRTDAKSVLFTEETINKTVLKKLKKLKYVRDKDFINLFENNIDFLDDDKKSIPTKTIFVRKKKIIPIGLPSIASMVHFSYYMQTLEILSFRENLPWTQNTASCLLTFSYQKYMFIQ